MMPYFLDIYDSEGVAAYLFTESDGTDCARLIERIPYWTRYGEKCVPSGFYSDGASIPRIFWRVVGHPFSTRYLRGAVIHDHMYRTQYSTRKYADEYFFAYLKHRSMPIRARLIYLSLRAFGWIAWKNNRQKLNKKENVMKKSFRTALAAVSAVVMTACSSTSTVSEYDAEGRLVKRIQTSESLAKSVTSATMNKTLILGESGWRAYVSASFATTDDPTPSLKAYLGKSTKWYISIPSAVPDVMWPELYGMMKSVAGESVGVSATGISSASK